jgi:hypothetical protein
MFETMVVDGGANPTLVNLLVGLMTAAFTKEIRFTVDEYLAGPGLLEKT